MSADTGEWCSASRSASGGCSTSILVTGVLPLLILKDDSAMLFGGALGDFADASQVGHDNWIRALVFHPSGKYLLSASDDKTIKVWELNTGAWRGDGRR
jgi:WD40 repeat protein